MNKSINNVSSYITHKLDNTFTNKTSPCNKPTNDPSLKASSKAPRPPFRPSPTSNKSVAASVSRTCRHKKSSRSANVRGPTHMYMKGVFWSGPRRHRSIVSRLISTFTTVKFVKIRYCSKWSLNSSVWSVDRLLSVGKILVAHFLH